MSELYFEWSCGIIIDLVFYKIFNLNIFMFAASTKKLFLHNLTKILLELPFQ